MFGSYLSKLGIPNKENLVPSLDIKLSPEPESGQTWVRKLIAKDKKTICLFTFATGDKCYSETWWNALWKTKKGIQQLQYYWALPVENVSQIGFKAFFYSKDIRQIGFIANTDIFIGADSGMMHLASASKNNRWPIFGHCYRQIRALR
jgi:hypothetical protein